MEIKFYRCPVCGNIITKLNDGGVIPHCCGREMVELRANVSDGKTEYHVPVCEKIDDSTVKICIGKEAHPMTAEHHIQWIFVETVDKNGMHGGQFVLLTPQMKPEVTMCVCCKSICNVYAYCNIHGLWKAECGTSCQRK